MSSIAATIILNYICPIVGVVFANFMYLAPLKDLDTAVQNGQGLNGLNPTPWALMLGNCLGWTVYGLLKNDYYLFLACAPGFLISCWLNLGAVKLLYSAHHQFETRKNLVAFLQETDKRRSEEQEQGQQQQEQRIFANQRKQLENFYGHFDSDDNSDSASSSSYTSSSGTTSSTNKDNNKKDNDAQDDLKLGTVEVNSTNDSQEIKESFQIYHENEDKLAPLSSENPHLMTADKQKGPSVRFANMASTVTFSKQKSTVRFAPVAEYKSQVQSQRSTELEKKEKSHFHNHTGDLEASTPNKSMDFSRSKSGFGFSQKSRKGFGQMRASLTGFATSFARRREKMSLWKTDLGTSFAKRKEKLNEWGEVVWKVTSQQTPAKAPHEKLVMGVISVWFVLLAVIGFYSHHADTTDSVQEEKNKIALFVIGYVVTLNKIFFYGAPLGRVNTVIRTKKCDSLHFQSLVASTLNSALWFSYGIAPQVADPFIWGPCSLGLVFSAIQFTLCAIFPRSKESEENSKRFSISSMLESPYAPQVRKSSPRSDTTQGTIPSLSFGTFGDEEEGLEVLNKKYMTSNGRYSYLF